MVSCSSSASSSLAQPWEGPPKNPVPSDTVVGAMVGANTTDTPLLPRPSQPEPRCSCSALYRVEPCLEFLPAPVGGAGPAAPCLPPSPLAPVHHRGTAVTWMAPCRMLLMYSAVQTPAMHGYGSCNLAAFVDSTMAEGGD
ncbi:hypothetical protein SETIT_8G177400v2 [Setaria italica]|uniref:Uncharacterized protein n=1 Tax=Setaria italica TaxID=4555 RepID=A0A368S8V7_SETIT|nr:hypothetical protein SETIT_8G177400v2 [Setaria italica]